MANKSKTLTKSKMGKKKNPVGKPRNDLPCTEGTGELTPLGHLASRVRKAREAAGFSVVNAAKKAGVSASSWYAVEAGVILPTVKTLWGVEKALSRRRGCYTRLVYG